MGLAEALQSQTPARRGTPCSVKTVLAALDDTDRAAAEQALADPNMASTLIVAALKTIGHTLSSQSLQRHRRRECACP